MLIMESKRNLPGARVGLQVHRRRVDRRRNHPQAIDQFSKKLDKREQDRIRENMIAVEAAHGLRRSVV